MERHEAVFEIDSKTDAYAVERLLERLHDALREESKTIREGTGDSADILEQFAEVRDAARGLNPGHLTVVYETRDGEFDE